MPRSRFLVLGAWFFALGLQPAKNEEQIANGRVVEFRQPAMGTIFAIRIHTTDEKAAKTAAEAAFARVGELNAIFSDYDAESELLRFCREPAGTRVKLSAELHEILTQAQELAWATEGAFDVTIGPLIRLWRQARRLNRLPSREQLDDAFARAGHEKLRLFEDGTASLAVEKMRLDLGGIAKGYAADEALQMLRDAGFPSAVVAASGDLAVGVAPPGELGWRIGLASVASPQKPDRFVIVSNCGISTSGDTQQFVILDGTRYSHIVNPATGLGLTERRSVNVIADNATASDSLGTAFSVLPMKANRFKPGFIVRTVELNGENEPVARFWGHFEGKIWDIVEGKPIDSP